MKNKLFLLAIPCLIIAACNSNNSADKASKEKADSIAAVTQRDSLLNAARMMHKQDSTDAAKAADSAQKADSAKGQK